MDEQYLNIPDLLLHCEENGSAPAYIINKDTYKEQETSLFRQSLPVRTSPVIYNSNGEEIFVVSDLHIASGRNKVGVYKGTENFFADDSFYRFLQYANNIKKTEKAILVINGDIFDFLRITEYPGKVKRVRPVKRFKHFLRFDPVAKPKLPSQKSIDDEFEEWSEELKKIGINKSAVELERSISEKEKIYGLRTDDYKTIYRLIKIKKGHPDFVSSLSLWLEKGNKIIVTKGNHDAELYWPAVRNYLRLIIAEGIQAAEKNIEEKLKTIILPNITFVDDSIEIDKDFYIEHGHRYDKFSMILGEPYLKNNPAEINIPFGSFINRYLLNKIELFLPFLDNVKPTSNILPLLFKENFPLAVKVLFQHIPFTLRILFTNLRYVWFMFNRLVWYLIAFLVPAGLFIIFNYDKISGAISSIEDLQNTPGIISTILKQGQNIILLILPYFLARFVGWLQLTEPSSLNQYAEERFKGTDYKIITMGHTHNPGEYLFYNGRRFYNTGTWIPIIETSNAEVREDKIYNFLHLTRDEEGKLQPANNGLLQRWNDDAGRAEPQILIERK